jgi:hypothetical protein
LTHAHFEDAMTTKTATTTTPYRGKSSLQRPRFASGLLLEDEDLTAAVTYTREVMRLMLRSLFGCGVVCGLKVKAELICRGSVLKFTVTEGVALDCAGDLIHVPKESSWEFDPDCEPFDKQIYVTLCYVESSCRPRDISCSPDDDGQVVPTRIQEGWEVKLSSTPPVCACSCLTPPPESTAAADCGCGGGSVAAREERRRADALASAPAPARASTRAATPVVGGEAPSAETKHCACYEDHNKGVCECGRGCACVLIGVIDTAPVNSTGAAADPAEPLPLTVDCSMRRLNRPVLVGFLPCIPAAKG